MVPSQSHDRICEKVSERVGRKKTGKEGKKKEKEGRERRGAVEEKKKTAGEATLSLTFLVALALDRSGLGDSLPRVPPPLLFAAARPSTSAAAQQLFPQLGPSLIDSDTADRSDRQRSQWYSNRRGFSARRFLRRETRRGVYSLLRQRTHFRPNQHPNKSNEHYTFSRRK